MVVSISTLAVRVSQGDVIGSLFLMTRNIQKLNSNGKSTERKLRGRAVSRGIAIGEAVVLHGRRRQFYKAHLKDNQIDREVRRLRAGFRLAKLHIAKLKQDESEVAKGILDSHIMILGDESLLKKMEDIVVEQKVNAEWAVKATTDSYLATYRDIKDEYLRERYIDIQDVSERLLLALGGERQAFRMKKNSIIVAKQLKPSTLVEFSGDNIPAIVTQAGGWTSHSFILARELRIPGVTGVKNIFHRIKTGDTLIVDGFNGTVIQNPDKVTLQKYRQEAKATGLNGKDAVEIATGPAKTLDGKEIILRANLDIPETYGMAKRYGAQGVGLFRSEFLFNQNRGFPSESEQLKIYRMVAEFAGDDGARIRTFDLNLEQIKDEALGQENNPSLGLRAIRFSLTHQNVFREQLRALLRAAAYGNIGILLPMVSDVEEIIRTKQIIEEERKNVGADGAGPSLGVGAMIEVPSAVMMIEEIVREVDFLCLGTNDLVQYMLGVDRDNELVADWFRTLHPAILRAIAKVIQTAKAAGKPILVCGEMAGSPTYAPILIGMGATELSMNANSIPRIRKIITEIAFEEANGIVKSLESCATADEIEKKITAALAKHWGHLFPQNTQISGKV